KCTCPLTLHPSPRSLHQPRLHRSEERERPPPGACFAHTGLANSVPGMAKRRRTILPLPRLDVSHFFVAGHRGREISLKASRVWTIPKEQQIVQRWYPLARLGRHLCRIQTERNSKAPSGARIKACNVCLQ